MQFPESWLRSFCNPSISTETLAHELTMAGLEVEDLAPCASEFSGVVVATILSTQPHPDADKLRVCMVDHGGDQPLQIVCGAPNAAPGIKIPLAKIGAVLPGGFKISKAKMRGVESFGMLCSAKELGITQDGEGLMILDQGLPVGQCLRAALNLDEQVFTLKLTPNKADCLSVLGVAREISALTGAPLIVPEMRPVSPSLTEVLPVRVEAPDLCGRFAGRVIRGVNARATTPEWMKQRLERAGQRSISALVDISNYVMLALGRPSHVFDLDRLQGGLTVRWGQAGESLELLNEKTINLDAQVGVVADERGVQSLAGIMGGNASAISLDSQNIYLEAAFWWPETIAGRSRRFNFSTDAGYRFERGVDFASIPEHIEYITALILDICGGQAGPVDDQILHLPAREPVRMRIERCQRIMGIPVSADEMAQIFKRLGLAFTQDEHSFTVTPPSYRFDLEIEEDLIEEVARIYGFERIPDRPPVAQAVMRSQPETLRSAHRLRERMVGLDYQEVINFSFVEASSELSYANNQDPIRLLNPIASQLSVMRSSLIGGLVSNVQHNIKRKLSRVRVFEYGRVFMRDASISSGPMAVQGVRQPMMLAGLAYGPVADEQWGLSTRQVDFYDVKADVQAMFGNQALFFVADTHPALHPGRSARIELNGKTVGWLGELHPAWVQEAELPHAPVVFELDGLSLQQYPMPTVRELSKQPMVMRDLALWVSESVEAGSLLNTIESLKQENASLAIIQHIMVFDVWRDKSAQVPEKSVALRFSLQDASVTLSEDQVEQVMQIVLAALEKNHQARLRI